ncbi:MAG: amino acid permease [Actinobacteria bacterium]|nr:MAG: amino acid permease [Actinomycetota bacterium]
MSDISAGTLGRDEQQLAELGYKQELQRAWGSFTNFAISFTIISVLAGTFTTFGQAWNAGGPIAISIGWPVICAFVLLVAVSMAELTSAFPTAGGPYWWSAKLGGPGWSWFTGWFNIVGLLGIVASVGYGAASFLYALLGLYGVNVFGVNFGDGAHVISETFLLYLIILGLYAALNIFSSPLLGLLNNISVGWHVLGVAVVIALLVFVPDHHQDAGFVFGHKINNTGFGGGSVGNFGFWVLVLPIGFLLTMYTQTGYDASAHTAEETRDAAIGAARGVWRSVFFSAIAGWFVLLAFVFAATDVKAINAGGGGSIPIFESALTSAAAKAVILIATIGQIFCGMAGLTSASRTWYAFSRDRAIPGWWLFRRLNHHRVPTYAVLAVTLFSLLISIPALWSNTAGFPFAFFALTGICTVGLYIAYVIPVYLRLRRGNGFQPGPWNLGRHYRWINTGALVFVAIVVITLDLPFTHAAVPWNSDFDATAFNYTPLVILVGLAVAVWWQLSAKNRYKGPVRTLEEIEEELEGTPPQQPEPPAAGPTPAPVT